ncbi:MAG TPA: hypothetical protein VK816_05585 [Jatrophihabitantaceae bacterium]|nr:hypothetical protein [Jatrophihabitantaceae bacterium]
MHPSTSGRRPTAVVPAIAAAALAFAATAVALAPASAAAVPAAGFVPVTPTRLMDTRSGTGAPAPAGPDGIVGLKVTGSLVPSTATAVVLNVTATAPTAAGYLTVWGAGTAEPTASNLNFVKGQTVPNLVIAPVGTGGVVDFFNGSAGTTQLIADVSGYFAPGAQTSSAPGAYTSIAPQRILDTRSSATPLGAQQTLGLAVSGAVPAGASAVVLNVTATGPTSPGYVTAWGEGSSMPSSSNLNFTAGSTVANLVVVPIGADGRVDLFNGATAGYTQVVADVSGYFTGGVPLGVGTFASPLLPSRALPKTLLAAQGTHTLQVAGQLGVPATGVSAVVVNVTVDAPATDGFLTAYPDSRPRPVVSNLNFSRAQTVANLAVVPLVDGKLDLFNGSTGGTYVIVDIEGFYLGAAVTPVPQPTTSHYVRDITGAASDAATMQAEGCADAEANGSISASLVLLDLGAQTRTELPAGGVELSATSTRLTYTQLESALDGYLDGYASVDCRAGSAPVTIAVATNNDGVFTAGQPNYISPADRGTAWANLVDALAAHAASDTGITVVGADDIEAGFASTEAQAEQWITAYLGATSARLVENGSADGCPLTLGATGSCGAGWTQADYYRLAHGLSPDRIVALPQIYQPSQAVQWADIDRAGATASDKIDFVGALTEYVADSGDSQLPWQGYPALRAVLATDSKTSPSTMVYSTDLDVDGA